MSGKANELIESVTAEIIRSIEQGIVNGKWEKPWKSFGQGLPGNAITKNHYNGMNVLWLMLQDYRSSKWATYKQWESIGAQVRKGEKGTYGIKWVAKLCHHAKDEMCNNCGKMFPTTFVVFNAEQVDGYVDPELAQDIHINEERQNPELDFFFERRGIDVNFDERNNPCYVPSVDQVRMPLFSQFANASAYYATFAHETIHWTGHESRLNRNISTNNASDDYAFEELVAELGAAMLCAMLKISDHVRPDHAQYLSHWSSKLKQEPKALWKAASLASKAVEYVVDQSRVPAMQET
jgi:antirestriction protein ArdC